MHSDFSQQPLPLIFKKFETFFSEHPEDFIKFITAKSLCAPGFAVEFDKFHDYYWLNPAIYDHKHDNNQYKLRMTGLLSQFKNHCNNEPNKATFCNIASKLIDKKNPPPHDSHEKKKKFEELELDESEVTVKQKPKNVTTSLSFEELFQKLLTFFGNVFETKSNDTESAKNYYNSL